MQSLMRIFLKDSDFSRRNEEHKRRMTVQTGEKLHLRVRFDQGATRSRLVQPLDAKPRRAESVDVVLEAIGKIENREWRRVIEAPLLDVRLVAPVVGNQAAFDAARQIFPPGRSASHETWVKHAEEKSASRTDDAVGRARYRGEIRRIHQRHGRYRGIEAVV